MGTEIWVFINHSSEFWVLSPEDKRIEMVLGIVTSLPLSHSVSILLVGVTFYIELRGLGVPEVMPKEAHLEGLGIVSHQDSARGRQPETSALFSILSRVTGYVGGIRIIVDTSPRESTARDDPSVHS